MSLILSIDPGREKCGVAVVSDSGPVSMEIVPADDVRLRCLELLNEYLIDTVIVGNGTGGKALAADLSRISERPVVLVDESHSSERARTRYLKENPPRGLTRLLPRGLRTPPEPYDHYVALILAEEYINAR